MKYYFSSNGYDKATSGWIYECNHPVYNQCTLYLDGAYGLAVIQQYYDSKSKITWWAEIQKPFVDELYFHPKFKEYFKSKAKMPVNDIYPTVSLRQIMWALRMKPIKREPWETVFDKCPF